MPAAEGRDLYQPALLWPKSGYNSFGQPTVGAPEEILVRWNKVRRDVRDSQGNTIAVEAEVVVDQVVVVGSHMWLGSEENWYVDGGSVGVQVDVMEVIRYNETPDLKNRFVRRTVSLARLKDVN
jgi:hypothetical protein